MNTSQVYKRKQALRPLPIEDVRLSAPDQKRAPSLQLRTGSHLSRPTFNTRYEKSTDKQKISYVEQQLSNPKLRFLPELRKEVKQKELTQAKVMLSIQEQQIEAGVRLRVLQAIKEHPQIILTPQQLRFESSSVLLARLHIYKQQDLQNKSALKIQAFILGYQTKKAFQELRSRTISIQRWVRNHFYKRKSHKQQKRIQDLNAKVIQKFCRGYLVRRRIGITKSTNKIDIQLNEMNEYFSKHKNKLLTDLQIMLAYLYRSKASRRLKEQRNQSAERRKKQVEFEQIRQREEQQRKLIKLQEHQALLKKQLSNQNEDKTPMMRKRVTSLQNPRGENKRNSIGRMQSTTLLDQLTRIQSKINDLASGRDVSIDENSSQSSISEFSIEQQQQQ